MDRKQFARTLLIKMGLPFTLNNMIALTIWQAMEGGSADNFNPLNSSWKKPGSVSINKDNVQKYLNLEDGVDATIKTLSKPIYSSIVSSLSANNDPQKTLDAILASKWGTASGSTKVSQYPSAIEGVAEYVKSFQPKPAKKLQQSKKSEFKSLDTVKMANIFFNLIFKR